MRKCGLEIIKVSENNVNGGSYRIYAKKYSSGSIDYPEKASKEDLVAFKSRIDKAKEECVNFLQAEKSKGKIIHVYGASTKGNVILQYFGISTELVDYAAEEVLKNLEDILLVRGYQLYLKKKAEK